MSKVRRYPHHPGSKGTADTGKEGASRFAHKLGRRQAEALATLEALSVASADEIAIACDRHWYLVRPRLSELSKMGLVVDSGQRAGTSMGGQTIRWRLATDEERAAAAAAAEEAAR